MISRREFLALTAASPLLGQSPALKGRRVFVVPNFHPASCGWLTNFSKERVYCANSYFDHLDRVRDDPQYSFVLSEVNNLIAMMNFKPERMPELRQRIKEGRVELVNAFFLESTINLSGGEALVRLGVEGLRWQKQVFGVTPRFAWTIDVCGTHDQMAQISAGLGLDAMVYCRKNPTGSAVHWAQSPDGTRILALSPGHYSEFREVMRAKDPLTPKEIVAAEKYLDGKVKITPEGAPILVLAGGGDYALAPDRKQFPSEFLQAWQQDPAHPEIRFTTLSQYLDALLPGVRSGQFRIPTMRGGTEYDYLAFWIESPRVKSWFRRDEHALQAAEMLATAASLNGSQDYPSQKLYNAWTLLFLSMDRNTLWGSAGGMVFEHEKSWDVKDRLTWVEKQSGMILQSAGAKLLPANGVSLFNPLNWKRNDPFVCEGAVCQVEMPSTGIVGWTKPSARAVRKIALPATIKTKHCDLKIDPKTGALTSLKLKPSGREVLGGAANCIVAERPIQRSGGAGDHMVPQPLRVRLESTNQYTHTIAVSEGPLATTIEIEGHFFGGGVCRRRWSALHHNYPRIDFETELNDIPDLTVVIAEFPLAEDISEVRRGIPYGFSHGAWAKPNPELPGWTKGIVPAVRWSHYALAGGGGIALLDRGLPGRELNSRTPLIYLYNATAKYYGYPNSWLSGVGKHKLEYALVFHEGDWKRARIPQMAWEYNCPPILLNGGAAAPSQSFLETSDNVIVEAMRRVGNEIEVRFAECLGLPGTVEIALSLPHGSAALTDMTGGNPKPLPRAPRYRFPIRPQQIVTMRFRTDVSVAEAKPVLQWDEMAPEHKLPALHEYSTEKGHPPRGN